MRSDLFRRLRAGLTAMILLWGAAPGLAAPQHGIAMYGAPALPPDFVSLPYANPEVPKGGRVVTGNVGGFDSLNPFILRGTPPWQLADLTHETLMGRSWDEPFSLYGLLAESVETDEARRWVEFTLRPEARFSDGSPVTVEDVIWSYETLGTRGHPRYRSFWTKVAAIAQTGPRSLRLTFAEEDRELALLAGLRPILQKSQWQGRDITEAAIDDIPLGTGPYVVADYEVNRHVTLKRNPDYWGRDLPLRRGTNNFNEIRIEFYGDDTVLKEAFKAGLVSYVREFNAEAWASQYDFPAVQRGEITLSEIPHGKPSGMTGFVMNTRRAPLDDWRVREALITAFNFEYINDTLTGGRQPRITSYFSGSELGMDHGPATGRVRDLLEPYADTLLPGTLDGYSLPVSDGTARNRTNLRRAAQLLQEAGWKVTDGQLVNASGQPLALTVLLQQDGLMAQASAMMDIYARALERLGITLKIEMTDKAQYAEREANFDFDLTMMRRSLSLSPGNEQMFYWGADYADQPGSRNLMGMKSPAAEAMIHAMLTARDRDAFVAATRALDRVLTAGRYVIPIHQYSVGRIAHKSQLKYPADRLPIYGDGIGFLPEVWWFQE
ncbi:ABC-type oligopeptide transport system, periplasmic component [Roseovarius mucosus DSM 17069]|uniref:ABC-type oligopeptide transport system, periplasmic component n=1 Tax=Roseovarius mucosus DSM 17069 TaxID=1288298 RepID=A0A0A0HQ81_9RHOB|nr:extracellular solute-binding protein [Roseovarius mucosus]KGM88754.1 ABC-type oligopeptide transport system, periplasmic component [Roseovarius mucosus DSM 17069]